jgi:hypothetical protein
MKELNVNATLLQGLPDKADRLHALTDAARFVASYLSPVKPGA